MSKFYAVLMSCAFSLFGLSSAFSQTAFVNASTGTNTGLCPVTAPCADLNYALSVISAGGTVVFLQGGNFGPIKLTGQIAIGTAVGVGAVAIVANPSAAVGCIGGAPGSCGANSGYAVEIANGVNDTVRIQDIQMVAGNSGSGALKLTTGGAILLRHLVLRGNGSTTQPIVLLNPNNPGTTQADVYFSHSDIGFNNANSTTAGAVLVQPQGDTSLALHFNHVEVHHASFGIRTDGSLLFGPSVGVSTFVSDSEFFSFPNAAVNAFSTTGTGTVRATFDNTHILNSNQALKANGSQSSVVLMNNTVTGNAIGVQQSNSATVYTFGNNGIKNNNNDISGTLTPVPLQ